MKVYRICNQAEAEHQQIGQPWQAPPLGSRKRLVGHMDKPVIYATLFPQYWRRRFVAEMVKQGMDDLSSYDYTLLLEVPDDVEERTNHYYVGMEYLVPPDQARVLAVCGPDWPPPDWCPQPPVEEQWAPQSINYNDSLLYRWKTKDGTKIPWMLQMTKDEQQEQVKKDIKTIVRFVVYGDTTPTETMTPIDPRDIFQIDDVVKRLGDHLPIRSELAPYKPDRAWFARAQSISGIHGIAHMARVLVWQEIIARFLILDGYEDDYAIFCTPLRWAAVTHDTQRLSDGDDPQHGRRAAVWARHHFADRLSPEHINILAYLNEWHVPADNLAPAFSQDLGIIKDADALDRVRFNGLNPNYLRSYYAKCLVDLAPVLYEKSEKKRREGCDPFDGVIAAAVEMGLVLDA